MCSLAAAAAQPSSISGRLATVEPSSGRITMIPDDEEDLIEMFVLEDSELLHEDESLTMSDLVILVGRRVSVVFEDTGDRRIALQITVVPE